MSEDELAEALAEESEAVWSVICAPTEGVVELKQRARFVLTVFTDCLEGGERTDNRDLIALVWLVDAIHRV